MTVKKKFPLALVTLAAVLWCFAGATLINLTNQVVGTLPHGNGGTDVTSPGASGNVLASNGSNWTSATPGSGVLTGIGTVTSVATGTGLTGGPVTGTGTIALTTAQTRRVCAMVFGSDDAPSVLVNADIAPQGRQCFIPYAATVVEVDVAADAGTPSVVPNRNSAGSITDLLSGALSTAGSGGIACANTGGTTGLDGVTTCSNTLTTTSLSQGDYIGTHTATAGGAAKRMSVFVTFTVN